MKILLAVDGSMPSKRAATWIAQSTALFAAPVEIVLYHAGPRLLRSVERRLGRIETTRYYARDAKHAFTGARRVLARRKLEFLEVFELGDPAEAIPRAARRLRCDVIVMGSRGHGRLRQAILGSVAAKVIAQSAVPVLVAR